jgi:zinc D-Ala-D-Ala dipeptidase
MELNWEATKSILRPGNRSPAKHIPESRIEDGTPGTSLFLLLSIPAATETAARSSALGQAPTCRANSKKEIISILAQPPEPSEKVSITLGTFDAMSVIVKRLMKSLLNLCIRFCGLLVLLQPNFAQEVSFRITPLRPVEELRAEALKAQPPHKRGTFRSPDLIELIKLDPTIKLDIRYASTNNFLGTPVYTQARAFLQRPAAEALLRAHHELEARGYGLIIHDGYRPWYVTKIFWDATPRSEKIFVANPAEGSKHNRGCAVDASLYDLKTGNEVQMPSGYDEMTNRAYANFAGGMADERALRTLLRKTMEKQNFRVNPSEWWHFDYKDWKQYPILNVKFEDIGQ